MADKPKVAGPMVVFRGGPRDGWVYYEADMETQVVACETMGIPLLYEETATDEPWSIDAEYACRVWRYTGPPPPAPAKPRAAPRKRAQRRRV
jgi:hypothetical protein